MLKAGKIKGSGYFSQSIRFTEAIWPNILNCDRAKLRAKLRGQATLQSQSIRFGNLYRSYLAKYSQLRSVDETEAILEIGNQPGGRYIIASGVSNRTWLC